MQFDLSDLDFLTSPRGETLLTRLADADLSDSGMLALITTLRKDYEIRETSAALELARLRQKGVSKFGANAERMFFTADALEQASHPAARAWRVREIQGSWDSGSTDASERRPYADPVKILDVCCGIGADALAFAASGMSVTGIDLDAVRIAMAKLNAAALNLDAKFELADAQELDVNLIDLNDALFFDPARRGGEKRIHHVERYEPPLSTIRKWGHRTIRVKLSPGVKLDQLTDYLESGARLDFISADGELKEAVLRIEPIPLTAHRAVMWIDGKFHVVTTDESVRAPLAGPQNWLVEPDPAIIRAGSVEQVAMETGGRLIDSEIAYFTTHERPALPYLRAWKIREWIPFNLKKLRQILRDHNVGTVTVKKRGTAVTPEALIPQLKLKGDESCTIILTRLRDQQIVLICDDIAVT